MMLTKSKELLKQVPQIYCKMTILLESQDNQAVLKDSKGFKGLPAENTCRNGLQSQPTKTACRKSLQGQPTETTCKDGHQDINGQYNSKVSKACQNQKVI